MSKTQLVALALAAVMVFWMLGAYNRLMSLRHAIAQAFAQLDEGLQRRAAAAASLSEMLRLPLQAEHGALDALLAADITLAQASAVARGKPADAQAALLLAGAMAAMASALGRVQALVEQRNDLSTSPGVAPHLASLREADTRIRFARQLFNDSVDGYNMAAQQFPTRWLAKLYGLTPAARL